MVLITAALALALSGPAQADQAVAAPNPQEQKADPQDQKADAKEPPTPQHTGIHALFGDLGEDIKHLPAMQNLYIAAIGGVLAAGCPVSAAAGVSAVPR